jgi:hypothetical protein
LENTDLEIEPEFKETYLQGCGGDFHARTVIPLENGNENITSFGTYLPGILETWN